MRDVTNWTEYSEILSRFLLTRPMRDVTNRPDYDLRPFLISTHTSHAGRDYSALYDII